MLPIFLLSLLLTYYPVQLPHVVEAGVWRLTGVIALMLLNFWIGKVAGRITIVRLRRSDRRTEQPAKRLFRAQKASIILFTFLIVNVFQWPLLVQRMTPEEIAVPLAHDLMLLLPLLAMIAGAMVCEWQTAARLRGKDSIGTHRPLPGLFSYLLLRFRIEIGIILLPWAMLVFSSDIAALLFGTGPVVDVYVPVALALALVMAGPFCLRFLWSAPSLPEGWIKERLRAFSARIGFQYRDILLWRTNMQIPNAAVIGVAGPLRYVFITDYLLECCSDDELESVFAHEAGHIKCRHPAFFLLLIVAFGTSLAAIPEASLVLWRWAGFPAAPEASGAALTVFMLAYTAFFWGILFGYVSRRFEREADIYAVECISNPRSFISALEKIALLSGHNRRSGSWRHFSAERRIRYLNEAAGNEEKKHRAIKTTRLLKSSIALLAVLSCLILGLTAL